MALAQLLAALVVVSAVLLRTGLHHVEEGHVGVYWRGGALLPMITEPGYHLKLPLITSFEPVQVTMQTDSVRDIPCGTSGGVMIYFDHVEVVNRLSRPHVYATVKNYTVHYDQIMIFSKIHSEINQFCSKHTLQEVYIDLFDSLDESLAEALQEDCNKWAPGIEIIAVRVTKPRIPEQIRRNYEQMEAEKTKLLIAIQAQKVREKEAETARKQAMIEAQKQADVSRIDMERRLQEQETLRTIAALKDDMHLQREKSITDAHFYKLSRESEANQLRLTPEFLEYMRIMSVTNNTKIYFGDRIPSIFFDNSLAAPSAGQRGHAGTTGDAEAATAAAAAAADRGAEAMVGALGDMELRRK